MCSLEELKDGSNISEGVALDHHRLGPLEPCPRVERTLKGIAVVLEAQSQLVVLTGRQRVGREVSHECLRHAFPDTLTCQRRGHRNHRVAVAVVGHVGADGWILLLRKLADATIARDVHHPACSGKRAKHTRTATGKEH